MSSLTTSGSPTFNGDSTVTIDSTGSDRVRAPASLLDETQCWMVARIKGFASTDVTVRRIVSFADDGNNRLELLWDGSAGRFRSFRESGGLGTAANAPVTAFAATDGLTVAFKVTATQIGCSLNGAAWTLAANTTIPTLAATLFDIGRYSPGATDWLGVPLYWLLCGTGTLTDAELAAIHAFGDTDKAPEDVAEVAPSSVCTFAWPCDTAAYLDEHFTILNADDLPRVRVDVDFDNDPTSATRTWEDVTAYMSDLEITRGRENELSRSNPGVLQATLVNTDRRFDPTYTSSPYYPGVKPHTVIVRT
ncbi:MAG: hypothetical protein NUW01_12870 [Gemmatimonadaceae bacterium]|nr:hypothetical protein [Gemmatimonadaceae bacterium]